MQYLKKVLAEGLFAVVPLTLFVTILQFTLLKLPFETCFRFLTGVFMVSSGLTLFLLGLFAAFAEPAVRVLVEEAEKASSASRWPGS